MVRRYNITVQNSEINFTCAEDETVLNRMIRNGKGPVRHGCCGGGCGVCKAQVNSGEWFAFKPMSVAHVTEEDKKKGIILLCCIQPRSDLVITEIKQKRLFFGRSL